MPIKLIVPGLAAVLVTIAPAHWFDANGEDVRHGALSESLPATVIDVAPSGLRHVSCEPPCRTFVHSASDSARRTSRNVFATVRTCGAPRTLLDRVRRGGMRLAGADYDRRGGAPSRAERVPAPLADGALREGESSRLLRRSARTWHVHAGDRRSVAS